MGEAADIGAFAAGDLEVEFGEAVEVQLEVVDADVTGFQFYLLVGAGIVEGTLSFDFDGRVLGRVMFFSSSIRSSTARRMSRSCSLILMFSLLSNLLSFHASLQTV